MPSGAKKRKAAKKKQASNSAPTRSTAHSHTGEDDLKHQDERDSDGGEGELERREDSSYPRSFATESKSSQGESTGKADNEEEGIVQIDWELKPEEDFESTTFSVESKKKSHDGSSSGSSSSSSSSSSSDDESHVVEKKIVVVEDSPANVDLVEPLDSFPGKVTQAVDDFSVETSNLVDLVKPIDSLSQVVPQVTANSLLGERNNLVVETPSITDSDKVSLSKQVVHVVDSASVENGSSSSVVESFLKENGVEKLASLGENTGISSVPMDLGSKLEDEEKTAASSESKQYVVPSTDAKDLVAEETEANPSNAGGHVKESETPQSSDSQPLVASAPRTVQTTSWKSCCGILELFTGSDR